MGPKNRLIEIDSLEDMINYQIYRLARLLRYKFQHDMQKAGLKMTQEQYFVLFRLWQQDGQYQAQLADDLFGDAPNITRILDVMEKGGLIYRQADPKDRRKIRIFLGEEGQRVHSLYQKLAPRSRAKDYRNLVGGDLNRLKEIFRTIENNITRQLISG